MRSAFPAGGCAPGRFPSDFVGSFPKEPIPRPDVLQLPNTSTTLLGGSLRHPAGLTASRDARCLVQAWLTCRSTPDPARLCCRAVVRYWRSILSLGHQRAGSGKALPSPRLSANPVFAHPAPGWPCWADFDDSTDVAVAEPLTRQMVVETVLGHLHTRSAPSHPQSP